jgi:hypothetical protein
LIPYSFKQIDKQHSAFLMWNICSVFRQTAVHRALSPTPDLMHRLVIESRQFKQTKRNEHQFVAFRILLSKH